MHPRIVPVVVAVSALVAASCGGSDDAESSSETSAPDTTAGQLGDAAEASPVGPTPSTATESVTPAPDPGTATGTLPEDTGPELQWAEVATDRRIPPGELLWTGSSFIVGSHDESGLSVLRSVDGVVWQPLSDLPGGVDWFGLHAADDSIVVWGADPAAFAGQTDESDERGGMLAPADVRIVASTDGGASWAELDRPDDPAERFTSPYLRAASNVYGAATSGDIVFVAVETFADELDFEQILVDNGVDPARLADGRRTEEGLAICLFPEGHDAADEGDEAFEGDEDDEGSAVAAEDDGDDEGVAVAATEVDEHDEGFERDDGERSCEGAEGVEGIEQLDITFAQLGLAEAEIAAIDRGSQSFEIFRSLDGGPFEAAEVDVPFDDWHPGWLRVVDGEFIASLTNESGETLVTRSADALEWEYGDPISAYIEGVTTDGVSLFAQSYTDEGAVFIRSDDGGRTWTDFEVPGAASDAIFALSAGPAGFAVLGALIPDPSDAEPRPFLIEKDGYGLRVTDDNETIVIDTNTGETVLYIGPDEETSELVIEDEDGVTLLDEETLEPLVTITWTEFEQAIEEAFGERSEPALFIGWSADGEHWGWQFTAEAFGVNGGAQFAVGDGAVVAMSEDFDSGTPVVRMFTAQVG